MAILLHADKQKKASEYICLIKGFSFLMRFYAFAESGMVSPLFLTFDETKEVPNTEI